MAFPAQSPGAVCKNCNKWFAKGIVISALEPPPESLRPQCPAVWISSKAKRRKLGSALKRSSKTKTPKIHIWLNPNMEENHGTIHKNNQKHQVFEIFWYIFITFERVLINKSCSWEWIIATRSWDLWGCTQGLKTTNKPPTWFLYSSKKSRIHTVACTSIYIFNIFHFSCYVCVTHFIYIFLNPSLMQIFKIGFHQGQTIL